MTDRARQLGTEVKEIARRSRLLSIFLVILAVVFSITDTISVLTKPNYVLPWYGYVFLLGAWLLNRGGFYWIAAPLTLTMFPAVTLAAVLSGADGRISFMYLVIPMVASSLLLDRRAAIAFDAACFIFLALVPVLFHSRVPSPRTILGPLILMAIGGTLAIIMMIHRDEVEADRQIARDALIRELEQKNAELERFTYTVSHDLKSPLITIRRFLGSIRQDLDEGRDDRVGGDIERILNATSRMQRLLDELLSLSRIGRVANEPEEVAFGELVEEAAALTRGRIDAAGTRLEVAATFPTVFVDRSRTLQSMQNLLDNAAKFVGDQKDPRIFVGTGPGPEEGQALFFVRDNGMGVEPANLERMLGLFEKLDDSTEGTGSGSPS
ncbi:MAG: histidine kinase dimerization/phospho-acceptor domain-containing protein [Vicinamibacteria bacterium]